MMELQLEIGGFIWSGIDLNAGVRHRIVFFLRGQFAAFYSLRLVAALKA